MTMGNSERRAAARDIILTWLRTWDTPDADELADHILIGLGAAGYQITPTDAASAAAGVRISKTTAQRAMDGIKDAIGLATNARDGNIDPGLQRVFNEQWEAYSEIRDAIRAAESAEASGEETGHD